METIERNFTNIEQSEILMALGIPKETADCYYGKGKEHKINVIDGRIPKSLIYTVGCVPCWSLGQLVHLYKKTRTAFGRWSNVRVIDEDDMNATRLVEMFVEYKEGLAKHWDMNVEDICEFFDFKKLAD